MHAKTILFVLISVFLVFIFAVSVLIGLDLLYHQKYLTIAGLNYRGYRGKVLSRKKSGEISIVMLGGSSLFGYGVKYNEAIPEILESALNAPLGNKDKRKKFSVINLAYNSEGSYAFYFNLHDFDYLDYDYVIIYDGYNDLGIGNTVAYRHADPVFRIFKYMPILPMIINEKAMFIRHGGKIEEAYRDKKVAFAPDQKDQIKIAAIENSLKSYNAIENILNRIKKNDQVDFNINLLTADPWAWYTYYMRKAIDYTLSRNKKVIIITQPHISDAHRDQQKALREMLVKVYAGNSSVTYFDLGNSISLKDESLCYDGVHLSAKGCRVMAGYIFEKIKEEVKYGYYK